MTCARTFRLRHCRPTRRGSFLSCKTKHTTTIGDTATDHDKNRSKSNDTRSYWLVKLFDCCPLNRFLRSASFSGEILDESTQRRSKWDSQFAVPRWPRRSESRGPLSATCSDVSFAAWPSGMMSIFRRWCSRDAGGSIPIA